ncbi:MAG: hypothetical protein K8S16_01840 [Bacteroidales bacterium]|nr:hypothetical protein [Bacteroidales bacterium]
MKEYYFKYVLYGLMLVLILSGCKEIDLVREAAVHTEPAEALSTNQIKVYGNIIDLGETESLSDFGFCWAINKTPTIADQFISLGSRANTGNYNFVIAGLIQNTSYSIKAYVKSDGNYYYGNKVQENTFSGGPVSEWLYYDDGANDDNGIGLTDGGEFDVAIRFPSADLQLFHGFRISKFRFFPREGFPVEYSVTIWEGYNPPTLTYIEPVLYPNINFWTEFILPDDYFINAATDLWVGYWVQNQPPEVYPAGVDNGPAITGFGDMISMDGGISWDALSDLNNELDFNWNLQIFVTNSKGKEIPLVKKDIRKRIKPEYLHIGNVVDRISSARQN